MNGEQLQEGAAQRAESLPGSELTHPFGPDWDVYKVRGKVFMLQTVLDDQGIVTLKSDPSDSAALRGSYEQITPGYHMNKRHWITLRPGGELTPELVDELVTESYLLVVEGLPKKHQPVDPAALSHEPDPACERGGSSST